MSLVQGAARTKVRSSRHDATWPFGPLVLTCLLAFGLGAEPAAQGQGPSDGSQGGSVDRPGGTALTPAEAGTIALRRTHVVDKPWSLSLGLAEIVEDNVQLTPESGSDLGTGLNVGISRAATFGRSSASLSASGGRFFYREAKALNQFSFGAGASASYAVTRRVTWTLGDNVSSSYAQDSRLLTDAGLVFPKVLTRTNSASSSLIYELTPQTRVAGSASMQNVWFDSSQLVDGLNLTTDVSVTHVITRSKTIGVSWTQTYSNVFSGYVQGLQGTWQTGVGRRGSFRVAGGAQAFRANQGGAFQFRPAGSVAIATQVGRASSLQAHYSRAIEAAYGFTGANSTDRLGASYGLTVGRRLSFDGGADYGMTRGATNPGFQVSGKTASFNASYRIANNLGLSGTYALWAGQDASSRQVLAQRIGVTFSYSVSWH